MTPRKSAIRNIAQRRTARGGRECAKEQITEIFAQNVFNEKVMRERLPGDVFKKLQKTMKLGVPLDPMVADVVANAMKDWAMGKGATHYTHWFQPMTGQMAEKHDSFIARSKTGNIFTEFSGKTLIQGEPDASSFPSGGMRSTFEARGYTAWDPTSPAFIMESGGSKTLCIPTFFVSYTGDILDRKIPLIRSIDALSQQALRILRAFGNKTASRVDTNLGVEQEYFLVDRELFFQRPDLVNCGRTLYGQRPPKGQDLEDHYFGAIPQRVLAFMTDLEQRLLKLGIPAKTRHNEVAPAQFEMAQLYESANIAADHNMLAMEVLRQTAEDHGFVCLLHEKPFAGINGSGKHNNWSMSDSEGHNLLDPGRTPMDNAQFLVFLAAVLRAVHKYGVAIRIGVVCPGNDHRLGANEAPPAILSVFLGAQLNEIVESIISGEKKVSDHGGLIKLGVSMLPPLPKDTSDRNRTSPVAFTGNKFEFRAVGSSQAIAQTNIAINLAVAAALEDIADMLEEKIGNGADVGKAAQEILQKLYREHKPVIFNDDSYNEAWVAEAAKRGLPNLRNSVEALKEMGRGVNLALMKHFDLFSEKEIFARQEILFETYCKTIAIEGVAALRIGRSLILPPALAYQTEIARNIAQIRAADAGIDVSAQSGLLKKAAEDIRSLKEALDTLENSLAEANRMIGGIEARAEFYGTRVVPAMAACRRYADSLEGYVDDETWPLPKYDELLWIY